MQVVIVEQDCVFYRPDSGRDEPVILALTEAAERYPRSGLKLLGASQTEPYMEPHAVTLKRSRCVVSEVAAMKTFAGFDVSQKKTSICVIDHNGNKIRMANVDTS